MPDLQPVGGLEEDDVRRVLGAAAAAPSLHNSQPWNFRLDDESIDVFADLNRGPQVSDPQHQAVFLAVGAALLNLKLAIRAASIMPDVHMFPNPQMPTLVASIRCVDLVEPSAPHEQLARYIHQRHTYRRPFSDHRPPSEILGRLRTSARLEQSWLVEFSTSQMSALRALAETAHQRQRQNPAFVEEWQHWTGRLPSATDGVPASAGGLRPEPQDMWVLRDFTGDSPQRRPAGKDFESDPLILCVGSFTDGRLAQVNAGQALQRILLQATQHGLAASFLSQLIEVSETRARLKEMVGGSLWPQSVIRIGYAPPVATTKRRTISEAIKN